MGEVGVQVKAVKGLRRSMTAWENKKKLGMLSCALALQITETLVFGQGLTEHKHQKSQGLYNLHVRVLLIYKKIMEIVSWKSGKNSSCRFSVSWPRDIEVRLEGVFFQGFVPHMLLCHLLRIRTSNTVGHGARDTFLTNRAANCEKQPITAITNQSLSEKTKKNKKKFTHCIVLFGHDRASTFFFFSNG